MSLYLYAITHADTPLPAVAGIDGAVVHQISHASLAAIVSPLAHARLAPSPLHLWQHEVVISAVLAHAPVLPVRFGTALTNHDDVQATLMHHAPQFLANLEEVRGCAELSLRVLWDVPAPSTEMPPIHNGRDYMLARLAQEQAQQAWRGHADALIAELHARLAPLCRAHHHRPLLTPRLLLTAAYLVEHGQMRSFQYAVAQLDADYPALSFALTGPWAAYSFVQRLAPHPVSLITNTERLIPDTRHLTPDT
jgi:hypothetical protein